MKPNKNQNTMITLGLPALLVIGGVLFVKFGKTEYLLSAALISVTLFLVENVFWRHR